MSDQSACFWPGSKGYFTAFKNSSPPGRNWKAEPVIVKFVSDQLDLVRQKRDKFINNSEIETSMDEESRKTTHEASSTSEGSNSSVHESPPAVQKKKNTKSVTLPTAPNVALPSTSFAVASGEFRYLDQGNFSSHDHNTNRPPPSLESVNNVSIGIQTEILRKVKILIAKVDQLSLDVGSLMAVSSNGPEEAPNDLPNLPVETVESVKVLDTYLESAESISPVAKLVAKVGGTSVKEATERVLVRIMSYKSIIKLVEVSVRIITSGKGTDQEIEAAIKYWLKHARARLEPVSLPLVENGNVD
ncbi:unnamed protein product [Allacma fusca]|uniref:Uncharacterized protein n=1 Tax=Allacma fusca TaxID=39272 RepID=A0A8J2KB07_9HEXA|nr:unnamed protein product [Allacma fusca]